MKVLCAALVPAGVHCIARAEVQQVPCGPQLLLIPMSLATCVAAGTTPSQPGHWLVIMSIMLTTHNTALIRLLCSLEMCRYNFPPVFRWAWRYLYLLSTEHKYICISSVAGKKLVRNDARLSFDKAFTHFVLFFVKANEAVYEEISSKT